MVRDTYLACEAYEDGEHVGVSFRYKLFKNTPVMVETTGRGDYNSPEYFGEHAYRSYDRGGKHGNAIAHLIQKGRL